jgi:hypothetical protein
LDALSVKQKNDRAPGRQWVPRGVAGRGHRGEPREDLSSWWRSTNCAVTGHGASWRPCHSTRRGPTPFSGCQKRARQWECTHRNLHVTGEESIKESNRDAAGCSTKNAFCCPRSYLVCPTPHRVLRQRLLRAGCPRFAGH